MISDKERRKVARRMREKKAECEERGYPWMCDDLILALGYDHDYEAGDEIFDRLADLIEPSESGQNRDRNQDTVQKESPVVQIEHECDRDTLLRLADEMDSAGEDGLLVRDSDLMSWTYRIRRALGVSDEME